MITKDLIGKRIVFQKKGELVLMSGTVEFVTDDCKAIKIYAPRKPYEKKQFSIIYACDEIELIDTIGGIND